VNEAIVGNLVPPAVHVVIQPVNAAEVDEMWSFVGDKGQQRWWWQAIDHDSGTILADVLGTHTDPVFVTLKQLLAPCGLPRLYTDDWGTYQRNLRPQHHTTGQENTQKIERNHLTLRTRIKRLARKTMCFSKSIRLHDSVIGLCVNRYEFGLQT
jgi:insertion element IS1 protein InsB